jgi:hypothetical protein
MTDVNFINIFMYEFFIQTPFRQLFLVTFWLWQKNRMKKHACQTLMKLTAGGPRMQGIPREYSKSVSMKQLTMTTVMTETIFFAFIS